ncbi:class I SAM-dependent RNA methyltransferase [Shimia litoralis]|uniref:Class I SAM-dependent RNA methyltransferase n=1 Tax=Shimia litoralis TaxID=420403 RepID=A0A4U7MT47_9RHOB|nr:class I SAM-dependent RNA methyltransferase [Shimia litoralis]TKZ15983.1 class I SAM-dependent RNA methyltransferase [Shimia litoralis]
MNEFLIERLGHHGDGIASGPVFAPLTLPGETVSGELDGTRLNDVRILTPSENRVRPPCRHFKACGGCQLQHASDAFVADWKIGVVRHALGAQGLETEMRPIATSPAQSRRRATLSVRRTKKGAMAGFHKRASDVICEIPDCTLLHPDLMKARVAAEALAVIGASRKAELSITATLSPMGLDLAVAGGKPLDGPLQSQLGQEVERLKLARLSWDGEVVAARVPPHQQFGPARVTPPPGAFLQATREGEQALLTAVIEAVGSGKKGLDLFAGCGTFTLPLALNSEMHAIESEAPMLTALDGGWRMAQGLKAVTTETRDLFRNPVIDQDLNYDFAVIDPPRAGAEAQVAELAASDVPVIGFVSCNPVTFARDAATLVSGGYTLDWVQVVDQFRWSSHVELVARFSRG